MRKKVGEILIDRGLITEPQLSRALTAQLIFGGHLGTCLMEMGMADEDSVGQALSQSAGVPYAAGPTLVNIPAKVIRTLPRRMAERYQAIPLKMVEDQLHVTMVDPRNVRAVDDMSFCSGYKVQPWISPEVRIYQALEKYYGVPRRLRYITLSHTLEVAVERKIADLSARSSGSRATAGKKGPDFESCCPLPDLGGNFGYGKAWRDIAVDLDLANSIGAAGTRKGEARHTPKLQPMESDTFHPTLWETTQRLTRIEDKQQAVTALLDYAGTRMERTLFLGVNDNVASVWDSRGSGFDRRKRSKTTFDIGSERLFALMLGNDYYRGPVPDIAPCYDFYKALGMPYPSEILMLPVHVNDHLVAIFYGDGGDKGPITGENEEYLRLMRVFSSSVELLILKERMAMIGGATSGTGDLPEMAMAGAQAGADEHGGRSKSKRAR